MSYKEDDSGVYKIKPRNKRKNESVAWILSAYAWDNEVGNDNEMENKISSKDDPKKPKDVCWFSK